MALLASEPEQLRALRRLRSAEEEEAAPIQRIVKQIDYLALRVGLKIDQDIPADDQIEPRKGRILQEVVLREHHDVAQRLGDPVPALLVAKEPVQSLARNVIGDGRRIQSVACVP